MRRDLFVNEPLKFNDRASLVAYLRSSVVQRGVADFLARPTWSLATIARRSLDGTTARAFHTRKFGVEPLRAIRDWAEAYLGAEWRSFVEAPTADAYQQALDAAVNSLQARFDADTRGGYSLSYGRAAKVVNLMLKHVALFDELPEPDRRSFFGRIHVALDRYTLAPVAQLATELGLRDRPSMGDVDGRDEYLEVQRWIRDLCSEAGVAPSTYEVALFNLPRGEWHSKPATLDVGDVPTGVEAIMRRTRNQATARSASSGSAPAPVRPTPGREPPDLAGEKTSARRPRIKAPRTAPDAAVVAHRAVRRTAVVEAVVATVASHRNAPITGFLEVVGPKDLATARSGVGPRRVRARITWFGRSPDCGYVQVWLNGPCTAHEDYTGDVVADLGYPHEHQESPTTTAQHP